MMVRLSYLKKYDKVIARQLKYNVEVKQYVNYKVCQKRRHSLGLSRKRKKRAQSNKAKYDMKNRKLSLDDRKDNTSSDEDDDGNNSELNRAIAHLRSYNVGSELYPCSKGEGNEYLERAARRKSQLDE